MPERSEHGIQENGGIVLSQKISYCIVIHASPIHGRSLGDSDVQKRTEQNKNRHANVVKPLLEYLERKKRQGRKVLPPEKFSRFFHPDCDRYI